jgi:hypothetical protein
VIGQNEIGQLDLRKMNAHGVCPIQIPSLRVADRKVAGETIVEAMQGKRAHRSDQMFFPTLALFAD